MRANNARASRPKAKSKRPRRAEQSIPTLQMTMNARQTDWTCPVCYARGTFEYPVDATSDAVLDLVRASHAIKQPTCVVSRQQLIEETSA